MANGLDDLARDLYREADKVPDRVRNIVVRNGRQVAKVWKLNAVATARAHGRHYPSAVSSDTRYEGPWVTAEIGPDKQAKQGALGNLLEFGSRNNPAHKDGARALELQEGRFIAAMGRAAELRL